MKQWIICIIGDVQLLDSYGPQLSECVVITMKGTSLVHNNSDKK